LYIYLKLVSNTGYEVSYYANCQTYKFCRYDILYESEYSTQTQIQKSVLIVNGQYI